MTNRRPVVDIHGTSREPCSMASNRTLRLYVETSVWNFNFAEDALDRMEATRTFFDEVKEGIHRVYLSDLVLREMSRAPEPRRSTLIELVGVISPTILPAPDETKIIVERLVSEGAIPAKYDDDAAHIAIALVNDMDVLLSWNFKHIVKMKTRRMVSAVGRMLGYKEIDLCTPLEVIGDV